MGRAPEISWALAGRHHIAYTRSGAGARDVAFMPNWFSNCELVWEQPGNERFLRRLESFSRLLLFDRRGMGLSDRLGIDEVPTLDDRADDLLAVLDAAGVETVTLIGAGIGAYLPLYFAATRPDRCEALVVVNGTSCIMRRDDYPIGMPAEAYQRWTERWIQARGGWGPGFGLPRDTMKVDDFRARYLRNSISPAAMETEMRFHLDVDLRHLLGAIHVPALVVHHTGNPQLRLPGGRYLAEHIVDARLIELEGDARSWSDDGERVMDLIEEFLTGARRSVEADTMLATVLYTDIVDSTSRSAAMGDRAWQARLDGHERAVRQMLDRHGGREVKTLGDGFLATFRATQRAIACARAIVDDAGEAGLDIRAGLHTGEIEIRPDGDIGGIAVAIASRVLGHAGARQVVVSQTVKDLVLGSKLAFTEHGEHVLKGVPGAWRLWVVEPGDR